MKIFISLSSSITYDQDFPKEFIPEFNEIIKPIMSRYPKIPLRVGISDFDVDGYALAHATGKGFNINANFFNREGIKKWCTDWEGCVVDNTLRGIIVHEIGHYLVKVAERRTNFSKFHDVISEIVSDNAYNASPYGQENAHEACAEAFVAYVNGNANMYPKGSAHRNIATQQANKLWEYINSFLK